MGCSMKKPWCVMGSNVAVDVYFSEFDLWFRNDELMCKGLQDS